MGVIRVQGPFFNFGTLPKFGTYEAKNLKFSVRIDLGESHLMDEKYLVWGRSQSTGLIFFNFGIFPKFRTGEARYFKFGTHINSIIQWMINSPKEVIVT